jgi:hypothetical protein
LNLRNFFAELKRRNVYKIAIAYAVIAWFAHADRARNACRLKSCCLVAGERECTAVPSLFGNANFDLDDQAEGEL